MSDLDEKLFDIIGGVIDMYTIEPELTFEEAVAQIKQAFADEGYAHFEGNQEQQAAIANMILGNKVMTGQEWYERFKQAMAEEFEVDVDGASSESVTKAAKKAAGV